MLVSEPATWHGKFKVDAYSNPFPNSFGVPDGGTSFDYAVYVPSAQYQTTIYNFSHWEDGSTNPSRLVTLSGNLS